MKSQTSATSTISAAVAGLSSSAVKPPPIPAGLQTALTDLGNSVGFLRDWLHGWFETKQGILRLSDKGASNLVSLGLMFFLVGRFSGAYILKQFSAHKIVGARLDGGSRSLLYRLARSKNLWERRIAIISTARFIGRSDFADTLSLA